jgi:hypothetical protein
MAHVISRRLRNWVETQGIARGICGAQSGIVMVIHPVLRFSLSVQFHHALSFILHPFIHPSPTLYSLIN